MSPTFVAMLDIKHREDCHEDVSALSRYANNLQFTGTRDERLERSISYIGMPVLWMILA